MASASITTESSGDTGLASEERGRLGTLGEIGDKGSDGIAECITVIGSSMYTELNDADMTVAEFGRAAQISEERVWADREE